MKSRFVNRYVLWGKEERNTMGRKKSFQHLQGMQNEAKGGRLSKMRVSAMIKHEMRKNAPSFPQERFPHSFCLWEKGCGKANVDRNV